MSDYICKHCKFNHNGWCVAKKKNRLSEMFECESYKSGKYGDFKATCNIKVKISRSSKDYLNRQNITISIGDISAEFPEKIISDFLNNKEATSAEWDLNGGIDNE